MEQTSILISFHIYYINKIRLLLLLYKIMIIILCNLRNFNA